jgi:tetratricopeptide (TPR) repeat protein
MFWSVVGRTAEGLTWVDRMLPARETDDPEHVARAHTGAAHLEWIAGRSADGIRSHATKAVELCPGRDDWWLAWALHLLGATEMMIGIHDEETMQHALDTARRSGDGFILAHTLMARSIQLSARLEKKGAADLLEEAVAVARACGSISTLAEVLERKAAFVSRVGDLDEAVQLATEALAAAHRGPNVYFQVFCYLALGRCKQLRRDLDAHEPIQEALALANEHGFDALIVQARTELGGIDLERGELAAAAAHFTEAVTVSERFPMGRLTVLLLAQLARAGLAEVAVLDGRIEEGWELASGPLMIAEASGLSYIMAVASNNRGWFAQIQGDLDAACRHYAEALRLTSDNIDVRESDRAEYANAIRGIAAVTFKRGDGRRAVTMSGAASSEREPTGLAPRSGMILHRRMLTDARNALGADAFDAAWDEGVALGLERVSELLDQTA